MLSTTAELKPVKQEVSRSVISNYKVIEYFLEQASATILCSSLHLVDSVIFRPGFFGLDAFIYFYIINVYIYIKTYTLLC